MKMTLMLKKKITIYTITKFNAITEVNLNSESVDVFIARIIIKKKDSKIKLQSRDNNDNRYRRLLKELARVNISIRYTPPCTPLGIRGKRSLKR